MRAVFFVLFSLVLFFWSDFLVGVMSLRSLILGGSRAAPRLSGVIAAVGSISFEFGEVLLFAVVVGTKESLVCFWAIELVSLPFVTLGCFSFIPPLGEVSLPAVLVGFRLFLADRLVIVALVASVPYQCKAGSGVP